MYSKEFRPVILGSDLNAYGMARSFHMEYNVIPLVLGRSELLYVKDSKILDFKIIEDLLNENIFTKELIKVSKMCSTKKILLACGDEYVSLIIKNKELLKDYFIIPYTSQKLLNELSLKENFYSLCDKFGFDYPKTKVVSKSNYKNIEIDLEYPIIIKPSNSSLYWQCNFDKKKKVYKAENYCECVEILNTIYNSNYNDSIIIQEYIPGDDNNMRVLSSYSGKDGKVKFLSLGHPLLEEHTPNGIGSYAAIMSIYNKEIMDKYKNFLEMIGFNGFSHFDLKYDHRDGKYKVFEINLRTGRGSYYMTASGYNFVKYLVDDYIYNKKTETVYANNKYLWSVVPKKILYKYIDDASLKSEVKELIKRGKVSNSLFYKKDFSLIRFLKLLNYTRGYVKKYELYYNNKSLN